MKQTLQLRLGQHLTMTPQLQQAIRLLQLSTIDLHSEVQEALDSNLMLENAEDERGEAGTAVDTVEVEGDSGEIGVQEKALEMEPDRIPDDLPVDSAWEDVYDGPVVPVGPVDLADSEFEHSRSQSLSLMEHLQWQLMLTPFSDTDRAIGTAIIDAVDETGYLTVSLEEIRESLDGETEVDQDEVEAVLHRIQMFDPPGVAARDLRDCLLNQLRQLAPGTPWMLQAINLVDEYLDLLAGRDYTSLMRRLKLGRDELQQVIEVIQQMNPRPGSQISANEPEFIVPDVFVRKNKGIWHVELNPETMPRVRINPYYASLVRRADNSADNNTMKTHLQEARWFLKSLQSRSETLL
ncbi:MAG: RNA polymerase sigma-54 factor, partial [Gammaproteobacteria bacterium]|nr:RNA polymerase sigma-54 factor [Gammaproteobacteria bacterium]